MQIYSFFISILSLIFNLIVSRSELQSYPSNPHLFSVLESNRKTARRLSKPLIRDDGRVYTCFERNFFAFESNGSIAWSVNLNYTCNVDIAPVHGGSRKIYVVADNRILRINPLNIGTSEAAVEIFYGRKPGEEDSEIIGFTVSTLSSSVFINVKNRGLLAYKFEGQLLWSTGPILYQSGYRQGCRNNDKDCNFISKPVIDQCEASIYMSNTEGEVYAISARNPHFKWVKDLSSFDKTFTITAGNNGLLYVIFPLKTVILALDVSTGETMWQGTIGPLHSLDTAPVANCNGWISIGSLDGVVYSFSPTGEIKKFPKSVPFSSVIQVSPIVDCSGYAIYLSQTEMETKTSRSIGEYVYISATSPINVVFSLFVPATGSIYWSEKYKGSNRFSSLLSESDLRYFVLDEEILLVFIAASRIGNRLPCRSSRQKIATSCSLAEPKHKGIYTGNERAIFVFLLFESVILVVLLVAVRFCCTFWKKKKVQGQNLGRFLEKRRSLRLQKKAFDRTISELQEKAKEESMANDVLEKLGDLVKEKEVIEKKLSTTYSLGRDKVSSNAKPLLPLTKSFSFQGRKKESVTIFHSSLSETSSDDESERIVESSYYGEEKAEEKCKGKALFSYESSSDEEIGEELAACSKGFMNPLYVNRKNIGTKSLEELNNEKETMGSDNRSIRKRTLSLTK